MTLADGKRPVAVIGLALIGSALADSFIAEGFSVTALSWTMVPRKAGWQIP